MGDRTSIQWLEETDSTQEAFRGHIDGYDNMSVVAARLQTSGRGQRGNSWHSRKGENLTFSMLLKFGPGGFGRLKATDQFAITVAATLGVRSYLSAEGIGCNVKWPNDIYVRRKKICGMLVENVLDGENISSSVLGIGLNVNQRDFPPQLANPTSMSLLTGKEYFLERELEKLCSCLADSLKDGLDGMPRFGAYQEMLFGKGVFREYFDCLEGNAFEGRILGVSKAGLLQVEKRNGELKEFAFKEISYII